MKVWKKLVLVIIAVISIILGVGRYFVVDNNFNYSIDYTAKQNSNQHILEKYLLESNILKLVQEGQEVTNEALVKDIESLYNYTESSEGKVSLFSDDYEKIYSNFSEVDNLDIESLVDKKADMYSLKEINGKHYMLFSAHWNIDSKNIYLINSYDVENIYEERDRQLKDILIRDILIVIISFVIITIFSKLISNHIDRLNLLVKQKDDFITGFTHELKTPMTAIMGYADMLRLKKCDEEVSQKALNYIYSEAKRLEKLSYKLMMLMSLSDEKIELKKVEIDNLINNVVSSENLALLENKVETQIENYSVLADSELLEVVIRNLVENANKSEPKDNKILIKGEILENKKYRISVIDKGKGIPAKHIERVTESFYMVDKSRNRANGGNGIGLSLVKKILELHDTKIVIQSEVDVGTTVYFDLKEAKNEDK